MKILTDLNTAKHKMSDYQNTSLQMLREKLYLTKFIFNLILLIDITTSLKTYKLRRTC